MLKNGLLFHSRWSHIVARDHASARRTWRRQTPLSGWVSTVKDDDDEALVAQECHPMLKAVRNAAASAAAWTLYHAPGLEGPVRTMPRMPRCAVSLACTRCSAKHGPSGSPSARGAHRADRRLEIGSVSPVFDVSSFTVKGRYFAHVPYEPGATDASPEPLSSRGDVFVDIGANSGYFHGARGAAGRRAGPRVRVRAEPDCATAVAAARRAQRHRGPRHRCRTWRSPIEDKDDVQFFVSCWPENDGIASLTPAAGDPGPRRSSRGCRRFPFASGRSIPGSSRPGRRAST